jgi:SpoVK/Ycf46/Vps4 family AAA+-type ATPase
VVAVAFALNPAKPKRIISSEKIVATINKLSKLFTALAEQNVSRAEDIASDIVAEEERKGHHSAAKLLRGSLRPNGGNGGHSSNGALQHPTFGRLLSEALSPQHVATKVRDVALRPKVREELDTVIREWRHQSELAAAGVRRRSRLFFHGPPGCGKSHTARALGSELGLPTFLVRFDGVIGAYLGQTAIHLREMFRFAERTPCVLVFDEVDALGKRRGNPLDVGELDRIVIAFMQELEHSQPKGLVIATSNLPRELDHALWRRFDLILEFPAPTKTELASFVSSLTKKYPSVSTRRSRSEVLRSKSYAEAERIVETEARSRVLSRCTTNHAIRHRKG